MARDGGFTGLYRACVEYRRCIRPSSLTDYVRLLPRRVNPGLDQEVHP